MLLTPSSGLASFEARQHLPRLEEPLLAHEHPAWRAAAEDQRLLIPVGGALPRPPTARGRMVGARSSRAEAFA